MAKVKKVPAKLEEEFIRLHALDRQTQTQLAELKNKFMAYHNEGRIFTHLVVVPASKQQIPWKEQAFKIAEKYMPKGDLKEWMKKIAHWPYTPIAPSFRVPKEDKEDESTAS